MVAEGVPFSLRVPTRGWWRYGDLYISKSLDGKGVDGRSDAEAIIFWTDVSEGDYAEACGQWWGSPDGHRGRLGVERGVGAPEPN